MLLSFGSLQIFVLAARIGYPVGEREHGRAFPETSENMDAVAVQPLVSWATARAFPHVCEIVRVGVVPNLLLACELSSPHRWSSTPIFLLVLRPACRNSGTNLRFDATAAARWNFIRGLIDAIDHAAIREDLLRTA